MCDRLKIHNILSQLKAFHKYCAGEISWEIIIRRFSWNRVIALCHLRSESGRTITDHGLCLQSWLSLVLGRAANDVFFSLHNRIAVTFARRALLSAQNYCSRRWWVPLRALLCAWGQFSFCYWGGAVCGRKGSQRRPQKHTEISSFYSKAFQGTQQFVWVGL